MNELKRNAKISCKKNFVDNINTSKQHQISKILQINAETNQRKYTNVYLL